MERTLKITNALADPTRFSIYEYITKHNKEVTVQEIAEAFSIHPNVARLHLTKLEDVKMLISEAKKTGKGGRPSRVYRLSDELIQLHFPFRDFQLLAKIALNSLVSLGDVGKKALYETGKKFGKELIERELKNANEPLSFDKKIKLLNDSASMLGFYPDIHVNESKTEVHFVIHNCPFKEVAKEDEHLVCSMHEEYLNGIFESLFTNVEVIEKENMLKDCKTCTYQVIVSK